MRARDDVNADQFTDAARGGGSGVSRGFDRANIAAHEDGDITAADVFAANQHDVSRFGHGVGGFDRADEAFRLDHSKRFHVHKDTLRLKQLNLIVSAN